MARWAPDARGRLGESAMELFAERGYEATTVADIAERAGLTERTFFRHYADKREVLFSGGEVLEASIVAAIHAADASGPPLVIATDALIAATSDFFSAITRDHSRQRQKLIVAHAELQERELIKMATLAVAVAGALRERGVAEPSATLAAEAAIVVFRVAFERWVSEDDDRTFGDLVRESLEGLRTATAA